MHDGGGARTSGWTATSRTAAVVGLTVGLTACGTGRVQQSATSSSGRLTVRYQAVGAAVDSNVEVDCETAPTTSGDVGIASANARRFQAVASPGRDWRRSMDVALGSVCTVLDRPVPPATLLSVEGGDPVRDGPRLTGVRVSIDAPRTVEVELVAQATP